MGVGERHDDADAPREREGRVVRFVEDSSIGVEAGMERWRYVSLGLSFGGLGAWVGAKVDVLGWNSWASGLKEKFRREGAGERLGWLVRGDGGLSVVEGRGWWV